MLTSAQIRYHKLEPVRVYFSEGRFRDGFYNTIQPDEQQKEKIDMVLDKYAKINSDLQTDFRQELDATMQAFRKELDSNLTKEQLDRLEEMDNRRQEMTRHNRRDRDNDTINDRNDRRRDSDSINDRNDRRRDSDRRQQPDGISPRRFPDQDTI